MKVYIPEDFLTPEEQKTYAEAAQRRHSIRAYCGVPDEGQEERLRA